MMNFCKEFNARTLKVRPEVPLQVTIVPRTDRSYKFFLRSPQANWFLMRVARQPRGSDWTSGASPTGNVTLKEIYHIARAKSMDPNMIGVPVYAICHGLIRTARAMGITVTRELLPEFSKRDDVAVERLEDLRKDLRLKNKAGKKGRK
jgi:large subunit ribosomal protein L11